MAAANAVAWSMPAAVKPTINAPSLTPIPPGMGIMLAKNDTNTFTTSSVARDSEVPSPTSTNPSVLAKEDFCRKVRQ